MIGRETRMLLRHYLEQGASKSALARQLGVSRDTVHRWIRAGDLDRDLDTTPVQYGPRRDPGTERARRRGPGDTLDSMSSSDVIRRPSVFRSANTTFKFISSNRVNCLLK